MPGALCCFLAACLLLIFPGFAADVQIKKLQFRCEDERIQLSPDDLAHATEIDWLQDDITVAQVDLVNNKIEKLPWVIKVDAQGIALPFCKETVCKILYMKRELHIRYRPFSDVPQRGNSSDVPQRGNNSGCSSLLPSPVLCVLLGVLLLVMI